MPWLPTPDIIKNANITRFMQMVGMSDVKSFHHWSVSHYPDFWRQIINELGIRFKKSPNKIVDLSEGVESPSWLPGASINIVDSCFTADPNSTAVIYLDNHYTYAELNRFSNQIANGLVSLGYQPGDAIGIAMPMHYEAVAIYLGIIKMGGVVVSIADSFSSQEIATRLRIANAKAIFTQAVIQRGGKTIPLYEKVLEATKNNIPIFKDISAFSGSTEFTSVPRQPMDACNILFSSGTTNDPKAIVWNHTTAIKAASDAFFHQDIKSDDVLTWPTNLGWMMGPWILFAAFINQASVALYTDIPTDRKFGEFIEHAGVTILGVVPTIVANWHQSHCMEGLNWSRIKLFTSTGECSNPEDMQYLMSLAGNKPVIEYCGGTEIGGAYVSSTIIEKNYPSVFTTPTMGMNFTILNENSVEDNLGEVAIIPPSIGLSTQLLNGDQYKVYYAGMPKDKNGNVLRRHGDLIERVEHGYMVLGRVDDTMNLGGIKTSSAEIERALVGIDSIKETAAIAISPPNNGPSQLVIYAATSAAPDKESIKKEMQKRINSHLNPLFKIHDVVFVSDLPKTASNKIMRRMLRKEYQV